MNYFQSYWPYFWQWEDAGEVVSIPGSYTIAYKQYLQDVLATLAPQGLPPFGSLLMAICATNANSKEALDEVYAQVSSALPSSDVSELSHAMQFLKMLAKLPDEYKSGEKRTIILQAIFKSCHNITALKKSGYIAADFKNLGILPDKSAFNTRVFSHDFKPLAVLNKKFPDVESILKKALDLPHVDHEPLHEQTDEVLTSDEYIHGLLNNSNTFPVASLIRHIWAGLHIPFHNALPSEQPMGGFADITNKGEFDRLLISEFANDDMVLLSRLANNEALFLHREVPPSSNDLRRVLLIDISLKNWGNIKTIAFACAIAIAKHPESKIAYDIVVLGKDYKKVSIDTIHETITSLQMVDTNLHAGEALELYFNNENIKNTEIFYLGNAESLEDTLTKNVLSEYFSAIKYWIHPDAEGKIDLYKTQHGRKNHVKSLTLPLHELWKKPEVTKLPAAPASKSIYPILLPNPSHYKHKLETPDGHLIKITGDKGIFRSVNHSSGIHEKGWELIYNNAPHSINLTCVGKSTEHPLLMLFFRSNKLLISFFTPEIGVIREIEFREWKTAPGGLFYFAEDKFYYVAQYVHYNISLDGEITEITNAGQSPSDIYKKVEEAAKALISKYELRLPTLKKLKRVYIDRDGAVVINNHKLIVDSLGIMLKGNSRMRPSSQLVLEECIHASHKSTNIYEFSNGCLVKLDKHGMITIDEDKLTSNKIYIPSLTDQYLGIGTTNVFSGKQYFQNGSLSMHIQSVGSQALSIVKALKQTLAIGLKEAKAYVDSAPCHIYLSISKSQALALKSDLEDLGAKVEIQESDSTNQDTLDPQPFFQRFIEPIIDNIITHAAKN